MTSKIGSGGIDNRPAHVGSDRAVKHASGASPNAVTPESAATKAGEGVHITDSARQLAALEQAIRVLPDVDEARVDAIRQAIASGSYQVSPERIADKLMRIEQDLLQADRS